MVEKKKPDSRSVSADQSFDFLVNSFVHSKTTKNSKLGKPQIKRTNTAKYLNLTRNSKNTDTAYKRQSHGTNSYPKYQNHPYGLTNKMTIDFRQPYQDSKP
jgi:hypothetical protein